MSATPEYHECCNFIPTAMGRRRRNLRDEIARNGQQEPILLDVLGRIIDGRARWDICTDLGIRPVTKVYTENAWEICMINNRHRFNDRRERIEIALRLPRRNGGALPNDPRPPTGDFVCEAWDIPWSLFRPLRMLSNVEGAEPLMNAVLDGRVPPATARRISRTLPPEKWESTLRRYEAAGAIGQRLVLPQLPDEIRRRGERPPPITAPQERNRNRYITIANVQQAEANLDALEMVLDTSPGIDPGISSDQAAALLRGLTTKRRSLSRLIALLKERKESTS